MRCSIVPPYLLLRIAETQEPRLARAAAAARRALLHDIPLRTLRGAGAATPDSPRPTGLRRTISTADHTENLPGRTVRFEGDQPTGDAATDEAYDGLGQTYEFFRTAYSRASVDN